MSIAQFKEPFKKYAILLITLISFVNPAFSKDAAFSKKDQDMLKKLSAANIEEVQLGKLVQEKAETPAVKAFGKRMVEDHDRLEKQVQNLASQGGISLTSTPNKAEKTAINDLAHHSGKDFDKYYIQQMLEDHKKDIAELQQFAESTKNPKMKSLAQTTLPILENHLSIAENVAGQLGISPSLGLNKPVHPTV